MRKKYADARVQKRIEIWVLEMTCEALLVSVLLNVLPGSDAPSRIDLIKNLALGFFATLTFFVTTGYVLTTAIADKLSRNKAIWAYPLIASILFLVHLQIFFLVAGSTPESLLPLRIAGPGIAFACTFIGSCVLARPKRDGGAGSSDQRDS